MGRHITTCTRRWVTAGPILFGLALTACANDDDDAGEAESAAAATIAPQAASPDAEATLEAPAGANTALADVTDLDLGTVGRDVIVEMYVTMSSADIARSVSAVTASAASLGGGVASSDVNYGADEPNVDDDGAQPSGHAILVVKVPPDRVDRLLAGLDATGTVLSINQSAQDVTDQLVDLDVRIANARTSVANVREFMEQTTNLTELVTLEAELTRRQTELEQLEAQQRNLSERVDLATITVEVVPAATSVETTEPDERGLADGLRSGWEAFTTVAFGVVYVVVVLTPFLVLALVALGILWFVNRRRTRPHAVAVNPPPTDHDRETEERERATPVG